MRLWEPDPRNLPQQQAYYSDADVLGYGGAAGGGKTDLLLGLCIEEHKRSIIFRREATNVRAIIDRAREILGSAGNLNETTGVWKSLPGGKQIEFKGVKDIGDEQKYRGQPHDFIGFDEADQFSEFQVRFLQGWLRTTVPNQRCRVVLTFNPPSSAEGRWLFDYFMPWLAYLFPRKFQHRNPAAPGELRWYATLPDGKEIECLSPEPFQAGKELVTPRSRTFIPARVTDNSFLKDTGYISTLQSLPEPLRSQVLHGDMVAGIDDDPWQVIPTAWVESAQARWRPDGKGNQKLSAIGVDVARGGSAKTVLAPRHGTWFAPLRKHPGASTPDGPAVAALVAHTLVSSDNPTALVVVDSIGVGSSVFDECKRRRFNVIGCNFASGTNATDRTGIMTFVNVRAFAWWSMRELLDPANKHDVQLPPDAELLADLTCPRWKAVTGGVQIERKEEVEKRIGRSPDCGDAVVYSIVMPPR